MARNTTIKTNIRKPNIFWFIIDSVRYYDSDQDDRDRIPIFDNLASDGIEFTNCITSAPSTLLSAGAMFTSMPSIYVARHYNDWKFKGSELSTLANLSKDHGYQSIPLFNSRAQREIFQFIAPPFINKLLPKQYKLSDYSWRNVDITNVFEYIIKKDYEEEPFCFTFWYDVRRDPNTNVHVERAINLLKEKGYYENSIIIMHSDHGYPDPSTKLNEKFFKNIGHDMILTDDNIKVPFAIKYPGCKPGQKITNVIGLIDVLPTIYDILKIPFNVINKDYQGKSILPIIYSGANDNRIRRSDTRLFADSGKVTSLRSDKYKYLYFVDENSEVMYDLVKDNDETINILNKGHKDYTKELNYFRSVYEDNEKDISLFHQKELIENFQLNFGKLCQRYKNKNIIIDVVTAAPIELIQLLVRNINGHFKATIRIISPRKPFETELNIYFIAELNKPNIGALKLEKSDLVLYLTENSKRVFLKREYIEAVKCLKTSERILINYNFEKFNFFSTKWVSSILKLFFNWEQKSFFYKQEPLYFFKDLLFFVNILYSSLINRKNIDAIAAKEILEMRDANLTSSKKGVQILGDTDLEREFEKLKTRE